MDPKGTQIGNPKGTQISDSNQVPQKGTLIIHNHKTGPQLWTPTKDHN